MNYVCNRPLFHLSVALKNKKDRQNIRSVTTVSQKTTGAIHSIEPSIVVESKSLLANQSMIYAPFSSSFYLCTCSKFRVLSSDGID